MLQRSGRVLPKWDDLLGRVRVGEYSAASDETKDDWKWYTEKFLPATFGNGAAGFLKSLRLKREAGKVIKLESKVPWHNEAFGLLVYDKVYEDVTEGRKRKRGRPNKDESKQLTVSALNDMMTKLSKYRDNEKNDKIRKKWYRAFNGSVVITKKARHHQSIEENNLAIEMIAKDQSANCNDSDEESDAESDGDELEDDRSTMEGGTTVQLEPGAQTASI